MPDKHNTSSRAGRGLRAALGVVVVVGAAFAIVIIGSLGNPLGTIVGGLVFGLGTMLMQTYYSSWSNVVPYALLLIIVLIRPSGLLGKAVRVA